MHSQQLKTPMVPLVLLVLFSLCGTLFTNRAEAREVHFDPESPAGKEYALPLQQARNEALGTGGGEGSGGAGSGAATPLFGVGVGGSASGAGSRPHGGGINQRSDQVKGAAREGRSKGERRGANPSASHPAAVAAAAGASYSSGQGLLLLAGILVLGIALGLGLRASGRHRTATG